MSPDDRVYLNDIWERMERIEMYTREGKAAFFDSLLVQDGVIRSFEVMGEAVKQLSPALRTTFSDVPWRQIAGFRDILIHNYAGVDLNEVWNAVERDIPYLKNRIGQILREIEE
ncbi:MAG: DUF86 domain-containing protein [Cyanobacteria bacterium SBLK]|nr:DUF86 domain-containing protein [Cyanobacteria bacterium SBLK]